MKFNNKYNKKMTMIKSFNDCKWYINKWKRIKCRIANIIQFKILKKIKILFNRVKVQY